MTFDEYLDFLEEYWDLFGPIPEETEKVPYSIVRL